MLPKRLAPAIKRNLSPLAMPTFVPFTLPPMPFRLYSILYSSIPYFGGVSMSGVHRQGTKM